MSWFSPRIVDRHVIEWQFENFAWLIEQYGAGLCSGMDALALPDQHKFDGKKYTSAFIARDLFTKVQAHIGCEKFDVELIPTIESKPRQVDELLVVQSEEPAASGRYICEQQEDGSYREIITYDPDLTGNPDKLASTFAHEWAHLLHTRANKEIPVEDELYELFTDLTAIYFGFGLLMANQKFHFSQHQTTLSQGWQAETVGYLPEADIVFASALFMALHQIPIEIALPFLKPHLAKMLRQAEQQLQKYHAQVQHLQQLLADQEKEAPHEL